MCECVPIIMIIIYLVQSLECMATGHMIETHVDNDVSLQLSQTVVGYMTPLCLLTSLSLPPPVCRFL